MNKHYYFVGIGGVGMSALAHVLLQKGHCVSGSDRVETEVTRKLTKAGAKIYYGQRTSHVQKRDVVVLSSAIPKSNTDVVEAKSLRCETIHRSELLKDLLSEKKALMIAGAHGKTTITTLLSHVLCSCKFEPSYVIGGFSQSMLTNGAKGGGDFFVAEADESDGSFLNGKPFGAILTSVDLDHIHYFWKDGRQLHEAYQKFAALVESKQHFFWCKDDETAASWGLDGYSYGFSQEADLTVYDFRQTLNGVYFSLKGKVLEITDIFIPMYGKHNALNATAVIGLAHSLGADVKDIRKAFLSFKGVKRRFEYRGHLGGLHVYDDYAHHPNEISVTIDAFKEITKGKESTIIFQPHRYSRLKQCFEEFTEVLKEVDNLIITDIYAAGEEMIDGICVELLLERLEKVKYVKRKEIPKYLLKAMKKDSVVLFLGAGDITHVAEEILMCQ